MASERVLYPKL